MIVFVALIATECLAQTFAHTNTHTYIYKYCKKRVGAQPRAPWPARPRLSMIGSCDKFLHSRWDLHGVDVGTSCGAARALRAQKDNPQTAGPTAYTFTAWGLYECALRRTWYRVRSFCDVTEWEPTHSRRVSHGSLVFVVVRVPLRNMCAGEVLN